MNTHSQAEYKLRCLGWVDYLKFYLDVLDDKKVNNRYFESDTALFEYVLFNLPLCVGDDIAIATLFTHVRGPSGEGEMLLTIIVDKLKELDIEYPYGTVDGEDALTS